MENGCKWRVWKGVLTVWTIVGDDLIYRLSFVGKTYLENGWNKWTTYLTMRMQSLKNKYLQFDDSSFQ